MCDFCHQHGEGKKWYLDARNYSEDLLSDLKRRRFIEHFFDEGATLRDIDVASGCAADYDGWLLGGVA